MSASEWFGQDGFRCRLRWGRDGAREAADRGDVLVVVDVLRFSTAVTAALERGVLVYPCGWEDDPDALAARVGGEAAGKGRRFSLSPGSFADAAPGERVVLPSPNGGTCSRLGARVPRLFVGCLRNARAVGDTVDRLLRKSDASITLLACGERRHEPGEDGALRFAVEDYLGAGAILTHVDPDAHLSPEARVCAGAFRSVQDDLDAVLRGCGSGRELMGKGLADDVTEAARRDVTGVVPVLRGDRFEDAAGRG